MKKCYCCGAEVPDNSKFCPKCGKSLEITQNLIDRAKAEDPDAQTELYERTYQAVFSRIRAKVSDEDTVLDIMQETYLRAFTNLDQLQSPSAFMSWLFTIAHSQTSNWYRKNGKEQENVQMSQLEYENDDTIQDEDDLLEEPEYREDFSPDESLDRAETGRLLSEILDTLPEDQRIILTMRYYDEMSLNEISEELGVNLNTVKTRLKLGKKKVEAKVLELEKSGTKLYSLGPITFLVYLLHHAELFAPAIPANSIIGLTAAGSAAAAGAGAAAVSASSGAAAAAVTGTAAKTVAVGAAVRAAIGVAVKGLSVKAVVAVAAAAVVVGGGVTTAAVVVNNNSKPSKDIVHEMVDPLAFWSVNAMGSDSVEDGPIIPTVNQAAELAADAYYEVNVSANRNDTYRQLEYEDGSVSNGYLLPEEGLAGYLKNLFGTEYQLSEFTNSGQLNSSYGYLVYESAFSSIGEINNNLDIALFEHDGQFYYQLFSAADNFVNPQETVIEKISKIDSDEGKCSVTVKYNYSYSKADSDEEVHGSRTVEYEMMPSEESDYGWIISQITYRDFVEEQPEPSSSKESPSETSVSPTPSIKVDPPSEETVFEIADSLSYWIIDSSFGDNWVELDFNAACEAAAIAAYHTVSDSSVGSGSFDDDSGYDYVIMSEEPVSRCLLNLFGSGYQLSDYTVQNEHTSAIEAICPDYTGYHIGALSRTDDGSYRLEVKQEVANEHTVLPQVLSISPDTEDSELYTAVVRYTEYPENVSPDDSEEDLSEGYRDVSIKLQYDEGSEYGWVVTSFQAGEYITVRHVPDPPSSDTVKNIVDPLSTWVANVYNPSSDLIQLNTNQAAELAAASEYMSGQLESEFTDTMEYYYIFPDNLLAGYMQNLFGSAFNLSNFTNTEHVSAFESVAPNTLRMYLCYENDQYHFYALATGAFSEATTTVTDVSECTEDYATYTATVQFDRYTALYDTPGYDSASVTVKFGLNPDETAEYGWAITSLQFIS